MLTMQFGRNSGQENLAYGILAKIFFLSVIRFDTVHPSYFLNTYPPAPVHIQAVDKRIGWQLIFGQLHEHSRFIKCLES